MSSDATSDRSAFDGYVQRAQLLAELGRYDEAAAEVSYAVALDPANAGALTMLSRVHLAADRPREALTAADAAVAAAPESVPALVARALALTDLEEYAESARSDRPASGVATPAGGRPPERAAATRGGRSWGPAPASSPTKICSSQVCS